MYRKARRIAKETPGADGETTAHRGSNFPPINKIRETDVSGNESIPETQILYHLEIDRRNGWLVTDRGAFRILSFGGLIGTFSK